MKALPLISVIVPVYNVSAYLDRCVESLVGQTYRSLEILLVDDGSTDGSGAMCDVWVSRDSRIRVIHRENGGLSAARNTGIDASAGEYLLFCDSDDVVSPLLCETLHDRIGDADIVICDPVHIFPDTPWEFSASDELQYMDRETAVQKLWYQTAFLPSAWGKLYRAEVFRDLRFTEGRLYEDIDIMHLLFYRAKKLVYTPCRLYGYVHRENSITTARFTRRDLDILLIADKLLGFAQEQPALQPAARAYATTAALRVWLNAPREPEFDDTRVKCEALLTQWGSSVRSDPNIRKKNRYALWLYSLSKPLLRLVYRYTDRWK